MKQTDPCPKCGSTRPRNLINGNPTCRNRATCAHRVKWLQWWQKVAVLRVDMVSVFQDAREMAGAAEPDECEDRRAQLTRLEVEFNSLLTEMPK